jgi:hypothetical protein
VDYVKLYENAINGESDAKYAFFVHDQYHAQLNAKFKKSLTIMSGLVLTKPYALAMVKNCMLFGQLSYFIDRLLPTGIIQHLFDFGVWDFFRTHMESEQDPRRVLSLDDLEFGFVIFLAAIFVSFLVFFYEVILALRMRQWLRDFIGLVDFLRVLKARLENYHDRW